MGLKCLCRTLSRGVPDSDFVPTRRENGSFISRQGYRKDTIAVTAEEFDLTLRSDVPDPNSVILASRNQSLAIRKKTDGADCADVPGQAGYDMPGRKIPDEDGGLQSRSCQVSAIRREGQAKHIPYVLLGKG